MADQKQIKQAQETYKTLCAALDAKNWKYEKIADKLMVHFTVTGEDIPMDFLMFVDADRDLVRLMSQLPFKFDGAHRTEGALVTSYANYKLADGSFDYRMSDGAVYFRLTLSYRDSLISQDALFYMVRVSSYTVDRYNDKFLMVAKGMMSPDEFVESVK